MELKIGDIVRGEFDSDTIKSYIGIVVRLQPDNPRIAYLDIPAKKFYNWVVQQRADGSWGADCENGNLTIIGSEQKKSMMLKPGDRVIGVDSDGTSYTGMVITTYTDFDVRTNKRTEKAAINRDDGVPGDSNICHNGRPGWTVIRKSDGTWGSNGNLGNLIILLQSETNSISQGDSMSLREKFALALVKEPQKSFRKAGVTDNNDLLTDEGTRIFLSWLLHSKYADEFLKVVNDLTEPAKE